MKKNPFEFTLKIIILLSIIAFITSIIAFFLRFNLFCGFKNFIGLSSDECNQGFIFKILSYQPSDDFFAAIIGLLATLISISIPITISDIADSLKPYKDKEILQMFLQEKTYKQMIIIIILLALSLFVWFFISKNIISGFILLVFGLLSLLFFYQFIRRVIEYITATDDVVIEKLWFYIDKNLEDE